MITLTRSVLSFGCALFVAPSVALAQAGSVQNSSLAELAAFLAAQPKWSFSTAVKASYGYKDNLLLSFADEERSPFVRGSIDLLLLRMPLDRFDFSAFAEVESTRYMDALRNELGDLRSHLDQNAEFRQNIERARKVQQRMLPMIPTRPAFRSAAIRCTTSTRRSMRSRFSSSGTCSTIAAASVPARGE